METGTIFITIWEYLTKTVKGIEPFEILISFITMLFAGYASLRLWRQNRQLKEVAKCVPKLENFQDNVKFYEGRQTLNPVALAMSLVPHAHSIKKDVEYFLNMMKMNMDIEEVNMKGINHSEDIEGFVNLMREKRHLFDIQGRTEVHLFIQGPIIAGILVGAMFDNWKPVKLYHKPSPSIPSIYQYWCPLIK